MSTSNDDILSPTDSTAFIQDEESNKQPTDAPSKTVSTQMRQKWRRLRSLKTWGEELALVIVAVTILAVIISILLHYNGETAPTWKFGLNLNTIVAVLATALRSSLVVVAEEVISQAKWAWQRRPQPVRHLAYFDQASRGPLGAFLLGFRIPRSTSSTAIACIVTVLSLALSSFTQQAVKAVACTQLYATTVEIPIAHRYGALPVETVDHGNELEPSVKGAVINAFAGSSTESSSLLLSGCLTGNCTFPEVDGITHRTNGICSKCLETTQALRHDNRTFMSILPGNKDLSVGPLNESVPTVSSRTFISDVSYVFPGLDKEMQSLFDMSTGMAIRGLEILTVTTAGCEEMIEDDYWDSVPGSFNYTCPSRDGFWTTWNVIGAACVLYPCVKDMKATVTDGVFHENIIRTTPIPTLSSDWNDVFILQDMPCSIGGTRYDKTNFTDLATEDYSIESDSIENDSIKTDSKWTNITINGTTVSLPFRCTYQIASEAIYALSNFLDKIMPAYCTTKAINAGAGPSFKSRNWVTCWDRKIVEAPEWTPMNNSDTWWITNLYNQGNATLESISSTLDDVARALTDAMRLDPRTRFAGSRFDPSTTIRGFVWQTTICNTINWPWLLFPITLVLLTALSMSLMIWFAADEDVDKKTPVWKSSALPLIYTGREIGEMKGMECMAEKEKALLLKKSGGGKEEEVKWELEVLSEEEEST